jgi:3-keto-5-aminohexanoate cleavage enzyme
VPIGSDEVIADALECVAAGATAVHFHARHPDGSQASGEAEVVVAGLAEAAPDLVVWPTPYYELLAQQRTPFAPLEVARLCFQDKWDPVAQEFGTPFTPATLGTNPGDFHMVAVPTPEDFRRLGAIGAGGIYGPGDLRWVVAAQASGRLPRPICMKLFFSETSLFMNAPDRQTFDLLAAGLADLDHESMMVPYGMTSPAGCEELLHWALDAGMGIRVGIGESPRSYPTQRNAELVTEAIQMVRDHGLEPASPKKFRARLVAED